MKCKICQGKLKKPVYRQWHPHFNFPAHGPDPEDWEECFQTLLFNNFKGLYKDLPILIELGNITTHEYDEVIRHLQRQESLELLLKSAKLRNLINHAFPVVEPSLEVQDSDWAVKSVSLDKEVYRRLVAMELEHNLDNPTTLTFTSQSALRALQIGRFPVSHPLYHGTYPKPKTSQSVRVNYQLLEAIQGPWINPAYALERILTVYAEITPVSLAHLDVAYSVIRGEIKPSVLKKRLGKQGSAVLSLISLPDLPDNKRDALKEALEQADINEAVQDARSLKDGPRTSVRVDKEDISKLKDLAERYQVPAYKLATALLSQVKQEHY